MNRMLKSALCSLLLLLSFESMANNATSFKFVLYYPQVPPYMYQHNQQQEVAGLIPALINEFFQQQNIKLSYVIDNRKGAEHRLYSGDVDAMLLAPNWAEHPEALLFSDAVIMHRDFLFATKPFTAKSTAKDWLAEASICTRQYYVYEALAPFFSNGTSRIDSSSEEAQLRMLQSGRCDYAYMNEHVAAWLWQHKFADLKLYRSPSSFGNVGLTIAMHHKWQYLLPKLNQYLQAQRANGFIERTLTEEIKIKNPVN